MVAVACLVLSHGALVPFGDRRIAKIGRFETVNGGVRCSWPGSTVAFRASSPVTLHVENESQSDIEVLLDGQSTSTLRLKKGSNSVSLGTWKGTKEVRLVKRTEAFTGTLTFQSLSGQISAARRRPHLIQIIGDSITCGFGNEGKTAEEAFTPKTENAAKTYGMLAATALQADAELIAWSGRTMSPEFTMPSIYDLIHPQIPNSPKVDFAHVRQPDVVIIHLGTNDFREKNPAKGPWTEAYLGFLTKLRGLYPRATLYCAMGSMMSDTWPAKNKALSTLRGYLKEIIARAHDPKLHLMEFDQQRQEDGIGSNWHPNLITHKKMSLRMVQAIRRDLKW